MGNTSSKIDKTETEASPSSTILEHKKDKLQSILKRKREYENDSEENCRLIRWVRFDEPLVTNMTQGPVDKNDGDLDLDSESNECTKCTERAPKMVHMQLRISKLREDLDEKDKENERLKEQNKVLQRKLNASRNTSSYLRKKTRQRSCKK